MRVAHFSDLHLLALDGVHPSRFLNKRLTGWLNLRLKRGHKHRSAYIRQIAHEIANAKFDHVVITGDLTNLALEQEFEAVRALLEDELAMARDRITIVPGNHDVYTRGAMRSQRFSQFFSSYLGSDLEHPTVELPAGRFPFVQLRGPLAFIGLSSAVPCPPLLAYGRLGQAQLDSLEAILALEAVRSRTPVFAIHHPIHNPPSALEARLKGLRDANRLLRIVGQLPRGLLLHGHLHKRVQRAPAHGGVGLLSVGATSASLDHEGADRMAGFNVYDFDDQGAIRSVVAHVLDSGLSTFRIVTVPAWTG